LKKNLRDLAILLVIVGITLWFMLKDGQTAQIPMVIQHARLIWVLLGLGSMAGVLLIDGGLIRELSRIVPVRPSWSEAIRYAMIGQYFNLITPFSSGSQPAMILAMTLKGRFTTAESTSVIAGKYVLYQIMVTLYAIFLLIAASISLPGKAHSAVPYALIGIFLHLAVILFMYLAVRNTRTLNRVVFWGGGLLKRIGFTKIDDGKVREYADNLAIHIHELAADKGVILRAGFLTWLQITLYFSIGYLVYRAFGLATYSYLEIMAVQGLLYMAVSFVPTPGNAGASEGAIYLLFGMFFPAAVITAYVLLWRFIVFYLSLLVSGVFTLYDFFFIKPVKP